MAAKGKPSLPKDFTYSTAYLGRDQNRRGAKLVFSPDRVAKELASVMTEEEARRLLLAKVIGAPGARVTRMLNCPKCAPFWSRNTTDLPLRRVQGVVRQRLKCHACGATDFDVGWCITTWSHGPDPEVWEHAWLYTAAELEAMVEEAFEGTEELLAAIDATRGEDR